MNRILALLLFLGVNQAIRYDGPLGDDQILLKSRKSLGETSNELISIQEDDDNDILPSSLVNGEALTIIDLNNQESNQN